MFALFLQDYLTIGRQRPQLDTQHDWMLVNSSEENGVTTLKFYRKRNTTDQQNDTAIPVNYIINMNARLCHFLQELALRVFGVRTP